MNAMINCLDTWFPSCDGRTKIRLRIWTPEKDPKGTIQIAHGLAGHCERFDGLARALAEGGLAVLANDHLGHGKSVNAPSDLGYFAGRDGWMKVLRDMRTVYEQTCDRFPGLPRFLLGHSMGSFLVRTYMFTWPKDFDGVVLAGTAHQRRALLLAGRVLSEALAAASPRGRGAFLNGIVSANYNRAFRPARTGYDWLTRDEASVDGFLRDPLCGFVCTNRLYADMMQGLLMITSRKNMKRMEKDLPVLFYSGTMDPVGENGVGVMRAARAFRKAGMTDVTVRLYEGGRHEMHNEINRQEVFEDLLSWISDKIENQGRR